MALETGNSGASSGLSKRIWDELSASGMPGAKQTDENDDAYESRISSLKKMCYSIAKGVVDEILNNLEIKGIKATLDTGLNTVFSSGVPLPQDGGATLQTAWKGTTAGGAADDATQNNDGKGLVE